MPAKKRRTKKAVKRKTVKRKVARKKPAKKGPMFIVQSSKDMWVVMKQGKKAPESKHKSKAKALVAGKRLAKRMKGSLKIKAKTGKIQATRNYA